MADRPIEAFEYTCDGCGRSRIAFGTDLPNGFHGEGVRHVVSGDVLVSGKWYACQSRCIGKAIVKSMANAPYPVVEPEPATSPGDDEGTVLPIPEPEGGITDDGTPVKAANPAWS